MQLKAVHTTRYLYSAPVSICHTEVHLTPRAYWHQSLVSHHMEISPEPDSSWGRQDYFGNDVAYFAIHEPHEELTITATSVVNTESAGAPQPSLTPPWEAVREEVKKQQNPAAFDACQYSFRSPHVELAPEFAEYGAQSFPAGRPLLEGILDLSSRVFHEFKYEPRSTTISTPVRQVLQDRHGVCQDFAHFTISCLRSLGLSARYMSGYLRSGKGSIGADASHAWLSVYCPDFGWLDIDPTNNVMPGESHITLAWGRDYSDVSPVKGVALGGGDQVIDVSVSVRPVAA